MTRQINDNGVPLIDGLEVFTSIPVLGEDVISFGNSFTRNTLSGSTISTTLINYSIDAATQAGLPVFKSTNWFSYGTSGVVYTSIGTRVPASDVNTIIISAVVGREAGSSSNSGIFQELNDLIPNNDYTLSLSLTGVTSSVGTISISRVYSVRSQPSDNSITLNQSAVSVHEITSETSKINLDFKPYSPNDIIFINYSSSVDGNFVGISSISINAKNNYDVPVVLNFPSGGNSKVLVRRYDESIPLDDGEPDTI